MERWFCVALMLYDITMWTGHNCGLMSDVLRIVFVCVISENFEFLRLIGWCPLQFKQGQSIHVNVLS